MPLSAADVLERLREDGESYESLASRLPISLSTVNRWKKESPRDWDTIIQLLDAAGLISLEGGSAVQDMKQRRVRWAEVDGRLEELAGVGETVLSGQQEALRTQQEMRDELRSLREALESLAAAASTAPRRSPQRGGL